MPSRRQAIIAALTTVCVGLISTGASAIDFGVMDARALAMGGTAVAVGNSAQAQYYNPALLGFHRGDEDLTRDGRGFFPTLVVRASNTVGDARDAVDDNLDDELSSAVTAFNTIPNAASAGAVATSAKDLRRVLDKLANKDVTLDGFIGYSMSEPSNHEGGAFYVGARVIGVGTSVVSSEDLALLDSYISAMNELAGGDTLQQVAQRHPDLINTNGSLRDPTQALTSSADVSALAIGEWGMALGKEFEFWDQAISFGITPKLMRVDAYRDQVSFNSPDTTSLDDTLDQFSDSKTTHIAFNADLGIAAIIADHYRVGVAVKDVFAKSFRSHQENDPLTGLPRPDLLIKLHPRSRMGLGYVNETFSLGLDYDLQESTPMANEAPSRNISFGAEYWVIPGWSLRMGYRQDQVGLRDSATSAGIGYQWRRFIAEFAYAKSDQSEAGGLQLGWAF